MSTWRAKVPPYEGKELCVRSRKLLSMIGAKPENVIKLIDDGKIAVPSFKTSENAREVFYWTMEAVERSKTLYHTKTNQTGDL